MSGGPGTHLPRSRTDEELSLFCPLLEVLYQSSIEEKAALPI